MGLPCNRNSAKDPVYLAVLSLSNTRLVGTLVYYFLLLRSLDAGRVSHVGQSGDPALHSSLSLHPDLDI